MSLTCFNTVLQPGGPPVKKEESFEKANDKKDDAGMSGTLERRDALDATC